MSEEEVQRAGVLKRVKADELTHVEAAFSQQSGVPKGTARCAAGAGAESRYRRNACGQRRGVTMRSRRRSAGCGVCSG